MEPIKEIADQHGLFIIEDAAQHMERCIRVGQWVALGISDAGHFVRTRLFQPVARVAWLQRTRAIYGQKCGHSKIMGKIGIWCQNQVPILVFVGFTLHLAQTIG